MPVDLHATQDGDGVPLVLLHAFPLSSAMWEEQRARLSAHCRVITPDQRGFGATPLGDDPPSLDACADDVVALLDRLGLDRVVLGGLSMGGYVAMALLRRHPGRLSALLLADTKGGADQQSARENRLAVADAVEGRGSDVLVERVLPALLGTTTTGSRPGVVDRVRTMVAAAPPAAAAWAQRAMAARPDFLPTLREVGVPALVVVGDEDALSPVADAQALVDALPHGRLTVLEGAGHLTAVEVPDAFAAAVRGFVAEVSA